MSENASVITGHYFNKHQSNNPLVRLLVKRYRLVLQGFVRSLPIQSALEIGSGEGYILTYILEARPDIRLVGSDITPEIVYIGRARESRVMWCVARAEQLPFVDCSFDLLLACEVLEHVTVPDIVLSEMRRLCRKYCIISVPNEPIWRILNIARGRYISRWGNTPGHIQHWSRNGITRLVGQYFEIVEVRGVLPWTFVLAKKS